MQVFYVNIGGGEPTVRPDFWELVDYATAHQVGVKFSTNGIKITQAMAPAWPRATTSTCRSPSTAPPPTVNDAVRGPGSYAHGAAGDGERWPTAGVPRVQDLGRAAPGSNVRAARRVQGDRGLVRRAAAADPAAPVRAVARTSGTSCTRPRRSSAQLYDWLLAHGESVLTGDSFFHLSAYGQALPGLNLCGAGRVVCLIDPVGDVYACPFAIHDDVPGRQRALDPGGFTAVWRTSALFTSAARAAESAGACSSCAALRLLPGWLHGGEVLHRAAAGRARTRSACGASARWHCPQCPATPPRPADDHSHRVTRHGRCRCPSAPGRATSPAGRRTGPAPRARWPASSLPAPREARGDRAHGDRKTRRLTWATAGSRRSPRRSGGPGDGFPSPSTGTGRGLGARAHAAGQRRRVRRARPRAARRRAVRRA